MNARSGSPARIALAIRLRQGQTEQEFINPARSPMPRTSAAHATEMRQRILDGAHRSMLAGGYRGTTMPAIATEAGVSVGLLYRYFDSKEELYLAMCEAVTQAQLDDLAVQLGQIPDPRARVAEAVRH